MKNLSLNAKVTCPKFTKVIPYLIVGAGVMNAHEDISYNGASCETSDWGMGFRGGIGVDWYLNESFSLGLEGAYVAGTGEVDHIRYSTYSLGLGYHF